MLVVAGVCCECTRALCSLLPSHRSFLLTCAGSASSLPPATTPALPVNPLCHHPLFARSPQVQLQLLTATVKLFLKRPNELAQKVISLVSGGLCRGWLFPSSWLVGGVEVVRRMVFT